MTPRVPGHLVDWQGRDWTPESSTPAAHPNSRFTVAAAQCPSIADDWQDPHGVVIDAIIFGGRRATNVPLVVEARDWEHGVYLGATISSERTAAAECTIAELRRDPFAMAPFCGYNMADYWAHWLEFGAKLRATGGMPRMFQVNWFRTDSDGSFLWPGFGENLRVLDWILARVDGSVAAIDSPLGLLPRPGEVSTEGLELADGAWDALFEIDTESWLAEAASTREFLEGFGERVPPAVLRQQQLLEERLARA
jgi:phosphoenolpyruvate carboxykinase (GTP)